MLIGIDISHHNDIRTIDENCCDFVIIKATEGKTWTDPELSINIEWAKKHNKLLGLYHYARPENNTPEEEAENFLKIYSKHAHESICALDWEQTALHYHDSWACEWLYYVKEKTGATPFFYCQQSALVKMKDVAKAGFPLWVARYSSELGNVNPFSNALMWQYTSKPIDKNRFYGDEKEWLSFTSYIEEKNNDEIIKECSETILVLSEMIEETRKDMLDTMRLLENSAGNLYSYKKTLEKVSSILEGM